ncbi:MAG: hypothetical protein ACJ8GN_02150 [Longimicrobiaceae bacterium]
MTTANWITIIIAILGVAVTWGQTTTTIAGLREQLRELRTEFNRSRESQGQRLEEAGKELTAIQAALATRHELERRPSRAFRSMGEPPEDT